MYIYIYIYQKVWADVPWMRQNYDSLRLDDAQRINHFRFIFHFSFFIFYCFLINFTHTHTHTHTHRHIHIHTHKEIPENSHAQTRCPTPLFIFCMGEKLIRKIKLIFLPYKKKQKSLRINSQRSDGQESQAHAAAVRTRRPRGRGPGVCVC